MSWHTVELRPGLLRIEDENGRLMIHDDKEIGS